MALGGVGKKRLSKASGKSMPKKSAPKKKNTKKSY